MPVSPSQTSAAPRSFAGFSVQGMAAAALALLVVTVRLLLTRRLSFCGTPDACYYLGIAQNLAAGKGFSARFLFDFQQSHLALPNTGIEYWRPGISLALLLLRPFGPVTLQGSIVLTTLVSVLFAAAAWHLAIRTTANRTPALASFAFCLLSSTAAIGSATPDSGLYYGTAVAWFLALFTTHWQGWRADALALCCLAFAYLIRNDAALLLVPFLAVLWQRRRHGAGTATIHPGTYLAPAADRFRSGASAQYLVLLALGFLAALIPMHLLYRHVLGTAFPSGTAAVFFLNDLGDFGRYGDPVTFRSLLAHGLPHLLFFRVSTFFTLVYRIAVLTIGYPALIFLPALFLPSEPQALRSPVAAAEDTSPRARMLPEMTGPVWFGLAALAVYSFVLPAVGVFSMLRTAVGLLPWFAVLVCLAVASAARTPRHAVWLLGALMAATGLASLMEERRDLQASEQVGSLERTVGSAIRQSIADPREAVVLTNDPVQFSVTTGLATVALPSNGPDAIARAAQAFHATHLVVGSDSLPEPLPLLVAQVHAVSVTTLAPEHMLILRLPDSSSTR